MNAKWFLMLLVVAGALTSYGQMISRTDAIWARSTTETIVVDGRLNEPGWSVAESLNVKFGQNPGDPGSGWVVESGSVTDPTQATIKFLVKAESLYVAVVVRDSSIGGGVFSRFDGLLMNIRRKELSARPTPAFEYVYGWFSVCGSGTPGALPCFVGPPRTDSLRRIWDAATVVRGVSNDDSQPDTSYTMELKFNLRERGYDVVRTTGDIVMFSISIYDADWLSNLTRFSSSRVWIQCPWGNANIYNHLRIFARADVTTTSGAVPFIEADMRIPVSHFPSPTLDGRLTENVWQQPTIATLQIKFDDITIRNAYPNTAPFRSGQFQPTVNGGQAPVIDPSLATVKLFAKEDSLFLGFDVNDRVVQSVPSMDRWDGFRVVLNQRNERNGENVLVPRRLTFRINGSGTSVTVSREDDLAPNPGAWDSAATKVQVVAALKGGTVIDTFGLAPDSGYTAEMRVVLPAFGYPRGRGDGVVFLSVTYFDGDSFTPASNSYGTRTWFVRESASDDGPVWAWMAPVVIEDVDEKETRAPTQFVLYQNYPNPFNPSTAISYSIPSQGKAGEVSNVLLRVYDVLGREVATLVNEELPAGSYTKTFDASNLGSGVYFIRLTAGQFSQTRKAVVMK